jgi:antitoxin component YwqK of YwqJK toxin-antitoxin module
VQSVTARTVLLAALALAALACGRGGEIDEQEVQLGDVRTARPATLRDGGEPVTGTVVKRGVDGKVLSRTDYVEGLPAGKLEEWYESGQQKTDRTVKLEQRPLGMVLVSVGRDRRWCENGTLERDGEYDADAKPVGTHREWTCSGKLLGEAEHPAGEFKRWQEVADGEVVLIEEGTRVESGQLDGAHRSYFPDAKPMLVENWKDGQLDGIYEKYHADGTLAESGGYAAGRRVGEWRQRLGRDEFLWDYDPGNFIDSEFAGPFMQAAGIDPDEQYGRLVEFQIDAAKIAELVKQGRVDVKKKLDVSRTPYSEFKTKDWTHPYVRASRAATPLLRELGADPKAIDSSQRSRLHYCVNSLYQTCSPEEVQELIALGLDAKRADSAGNTPLHLLMNLHQIPEAPGAQRWRQATLADLEPTMSALLGAGADVDAVNHDGLTPLVLALRGQLWDVAAFVVEKTEKPTFTTKEGHNLIHLAFVVSGTSQIDLELTDGRRVYVERAVARGVDPRQRLGGDASLAEIAQRNGATELAEFLTQLK